MAPNPLGDPLGAIGRRTRDLLYTGVGLGVLGLQRVQVRRRELESSLGVSLPPSPDELGRLLGRISGSR
ncbi:MAG TPA: hypothetical protein VIY72_09935 [Acidimicrobiales bacterium]